MNGKSFEISANTEYSNVTIFDVEAKHVDNTEGQYFITENKRNTYLNQNTKLYTDTNSESTRIFDQNGIEIIGRTSECTYPKREYNGGKFIFGLTEMSFRTPEIRREFVTHREGLEKAVHYYSAYDSRGNRVEDEQESYYKLNNEHGLAVMNFNSQKLSKEQYDRISDFYTEEQLSELLAHEEDNLAREALSKMYLNPTSMSR